MAPSEPALVPELLVTDIARSLRFWRDLCGFETLYQREDEGFAYLVRENVHVMLEQAGIGRNWVAGVLDPPLGRGLNLQISVTDLTPLLHALRSISHALFMEPERKWYRVGANEEAGVEQFVVADPDGYLLRFQASLGRRLHLR